MLVQMHFNQHIIFVLRIPVKIKKEMHKIDDISQTVGRRELILTHI